MYGNRILVTMMAGLIGWAVPATSPAIDVPAINMNVSQSHDMREAKAFFTHLADTSKNPLIVSMARDSLRKIRDAAEPQKNAKSTAEVTMLPQGDNTFVVPAVVNRRYMATFLVDTGASYTVITPQMAEELGIKIHEDTPTMPVTTANGTLNAPVVTLRHVTLGGMEVDGVEAVVTDLGDTPQLSGLLGMSFFRGMELSFKRDKLVISR